MAVGCFKLTKSDRLESEHRRGLRLLGIYSLLIASGLYWVPWSIYFMDFSVALDPLITAYWLIWIDIVVITFLYSVRKAVHYIT